MSLYIRTFNTSSGATAVQIVHSTHHGSRDIGHIGSGHNEPEVEVLKAATRLGLHADQDSMDFGDGQIGAMELAIPSNWSKHL